MEVNELRFAKASVEMEMRELQTAYEAVSDTAASLEVGTAKQQGEMGCQGVVLASWQ